MPNAAVLALEKPRAGVNQPGVPFTPRYSHSGVDTKVDGGATSCAEDLGSRGILRVFSDVKWVRGRWREQEDTEEIVAHGRT
jgi:hypothetical protein